MGAVSFGLEKALGRRTSRRQDDMVPNADCVACKLQRVILWDEQLPVLLDSLGNRGLPIGVKG